VCIYIYIYIHTHTHTHTNEIIWYFVFLGRVTNPSAKPPFLEDQFVSPSLATKRDMTGLEAAEMRFLRSVTGYTKLDKIRREVIRKELEISGTQDVRLKYKQNSINHLERTDNTRLPKHGLNYRPRGRRYRRRPRKRWQCVDAGIGQTT